MERVLANKANYLVQRGYEVAIVTTDQQGRSSYFPMDSRIAHHDLGINYGETKHKGLLHKMLHYPGKQRRHLRRLQVLLAAWRPDVVISMFDHDADLLWRLKDSSKKVLEIHFSRFKRMQYGRSGLWRLIDTWRSKQDVVIARRYDRFVVLTEEDRGYWEEVPNITVIPNAHSFSPGEPSNLEDKRVIAVGRYDYQKRFDDLIEAWTDVYRACPDWRLDIFGEGELVDDYRRQIDRLGLTKVVTLRAPVANIQEEYLKSSLIAMTSRYEGLPMALLEAQVCGLPLVSYTCKCGPKDIIIPGENGYLIDEGDKLGMATALIRIMKDEELKRALGDASRRLSERFSPEQVMAKWEALFQQI